jgi:hypothetical protein
MSADGACGRVVIFIECIREDLNERDVAPSATSAFECLLVSFRNLISSTDEFDECLTLGPRVGPAAHATVCVAGVPGVTGILKHLVLDGNCALE